MSLRHFSVLAVPLVLFSAPLFAQGSFPERLQAVMNRPEFAHAHFGIEICSLDTGARVFALNENKFFVPASTTKLLTEGTALELLGPDYRFHTRIYRTGKINSHGVLDGNLVLVASGDPDLSGRIQADGTLGFENEDHSYGGVDSKGLPGDPLQVMAQLADQIAAKGIRKIKGRVLVDAKLFPEGTRELGTGVVISPIVVNDNIIDVLASPGATEGAPVKLQIRPETGYLHFVNHATTTKAGIRGDINYDDGELHTDGTRTVTVNGSLPLGAATAMYSYAVPEPSRFAATAVVELLRKRGIEIADKGTATTRGTNPQPLAADYDTDHLVAEHISPPLSEEVKITLKVSQNLHASMTPFLLGAILAHADKDIDQAGFVRERGFLQGLGLDLSGAAQGDGAGGNAFFTPDFMVHYLIAMSKERAFTIFRNALPVLGRDGTLAKIQTGSPAAGHVFAKTGTLTSYDALNRKIMVTERALRDTSTLPFRHISSSPFT